VIFRLLPARPGRPTVLALHGRGAEEGQLLPLLRAADRSCGVLAPRGQVPCPPGWAWCRRHAVGMPVPSDLRRRAEALGDWLDQGLGTLGIPAPLAVVGYSNGAMLAVTFAAARPELVGALALLRGAYPLPSLAARAGLAGTRILASAGAADELLSPDAFAAGVRQLRRLGANVDARVYPGLGHGLGLADAHELRRWLEGLALAEPLSVSARPGEARRLSSSC
jgi:phospholipase/carboxylesterase